MKITYIHQHFKLPSEPGGSRPYEFAKRLVGDGHQVTMICGGSEPMHMTVDGINVVRVEVPYSNEMSYTARIFSFLQFLWKSTIVGCKTKADVVFASSTPLTVAVPGILAAKINRARFVFEVRDLWPAVPIKLGILKNPVIIAIAKLLEKLTYSLADRVIALSPSMAAGVSAVNDKVPVEVIPNAADFDGFNRNTSQRKADRAEFGWDIEDVIVIYAGGFGMSYQLDWVVRLASKVSVSDRGTRIKFILFGSGADFDDLTTLAKSLGLDAAEILPGPIKKSEVYRRIAAADAVLSPLRDDPALEGNSLNKVFDAMAAGRPVLFNHRGWLHDKMVGRGAGWHLDRNLDIAKDQVVKILNNRENVVAAGVRAAEIGREEFSREVLYEKFSNAVLGNSNDVKGI